jgi:Lon protease-like protein
MASRVVPLFPLPRVWLFPYVVLPLNIFEERYRQMIEDSLDGPGRIVLGTVEQGAEAQLSGTPPVYPVAGLGEIGRHQRLDDGRFNVWLVGLQRVLVREVPSERLYRRVEVQPAQEIAVPAEREAELRSRLVSAILERTQNLATIPPLVPLSHLTDLLVLRVPLAFQDLNQLFAELDVERRALRALELHEVRPKKSGPAEGGEAQPPFGFFSTE